jgi:hypothetical protein
MLGCSYGLRSYLLGIISVKYMLSDYVNSVLPIEKYESVLIYF